MHHGLDPAGLHRRDHVRRSVVQRIHHGNSRIQEMAMIAGGEKRSSGQCDSSNQGVALVDRCALGLALGCQSGGLRQFKLRGTEKVSAVIGLHE